jgi:hypothetical protein
VSNIPTMMTIVKVRRGAAAVAVVVTVWAVAGGSGAGATTVSADEYVQTVCGAIAPFGDLTAQLGVGLKQASDAYRAQPSQTTAVALRQAFEDYLDQSAEAVDNVTATVRSAGTPDVKGGAQFAAAVAAQFVAAAKAMHALGSQAAVIDVGSAARFAADVQRVSKKTEAVQKQLIKASKRNPSIKNAAAPLRPLVEFMTTDATSCPV